MLCAAIKSCHGQKAAISIHISINGQNGMAFMEGRVFHAYKMNHMKPVLMNGHLYWAEIPENRLYIKADDKIWNADQSGCTFGKYLTVAEIRQVENSMKNDEDKQRVQQILKRDQLA